MLKDTKDYIHFRLLLFTRSYLTPSRTLILGYIFFIILGSFLLMLPFSSVEGSTSPINSVFTATSAICVTGLIVEDTAVHWSIFGKLIIMLLIQIGGLGYMTIATFIIITFGRKIDIYSRMVMKEGVNQPTISGLGRFTRKVIKITLFLELIGALILSIKMIPLYGFTRGIGHAVFHSISAFCNAGFSTFSDNLYNFKSDYTILLTISSLFILGGFGFIVILDLRNHFIWLIKKFKLTKKKIPHHTLTPYSKVVLFSYLLLIVIPFIIFVLLDFNFFKNFNTFEGITNIFFHVTTPRTAGFNTIDYNFFTSGTIIITMILMFIGTAPGGTGGGVKVTTIAVIISNILTTLRWKDKTILFKRKVDLITINRAFSLVIISTLWIVLTFTLIMLSAPDNVISRGAAKILFEVVSAFGTVGLSLNASTKNNCSFSADLNAIGKFLIITTMLIGRVGPLTFGSALLNRKPSKRINYVRGFFPVG